MPVAKEDVTFRHYDVDGELLSEEVMNRNVYRPVNGAPYISVLGGKQPLTESQPPVVEIRPRRVAAMSGRAVLDRLRAHADAGGGVRIVGRGDGFGIQADVPPREE